jgi:bifunctional UDP-N-acetylglucosamine pyrophosphorylase/glucosamine-1-phosphate N-acetyltransferase
MQMRGKSRDIAVLILAAGKGTRMRSDRAKVLHPIAGRPMLDYPLAAAEGLDPARLIVVTGRDSDAVQEAFAGRARFVLQAEQRGTGHAVLQARPALADFHGDALILYGDTPLLRSETLRRMAALKAETRADLVLLTAPVDVRGIIVRDGEGRVAQVVEATDATPEELAIEERNTGVYMLDAELLWKTLARVDDRNRQGEIYLTDIVERSVREGCRVEALCLEDTEEALGVDTRAQLAQAGAAVRRRKLNQLMADGVTIVDPAATYVDVEVEVGRDTLIEPGCVIQGPTRIGSGVHVKPHCTIESSQLGDGAQIGPCAHLRPGTVLGPRVRIGNFVEVKNSILGEGVKADHLSYIGDADVGAGASFGCGVIVVNYDGVQKHRTAVGERAFIGCNANLVAPVTIAEDSFVAAGSTITKDVPPEALAVARSRQHHVEGWVARRGGKDGSGGTSAGAKGADEKQAKAGTDAGGPASKRSG